MDLSLLCWICTHSWWKPELEMPVRSFNTFVFNELRVYTHKRRSLVVRHGLLCVDKPDTCPFDLEEDKLRFWLGRWNGCNGGQGCLLGLALFPCGLFEEPTYTGFKLATSSRWLGLSPLRCSFTLHWSLQMIAFT